MKKILPIILGLVFFGAQAVALHTPDIPTPEYKPPHHVVHKKPVPKPTPVAPAATPPPVTPKPVPKPVAGIALNGLEAGINAVRAAHGLAPLAANGALRSAALAHAQHMCATNTFSHDGWEGYIRASGYSGNYIGENIAAGQTSDQVVQAWVNSPEHYENIVNPNYKVQGIASYNCPTTYSPSTIPVIYVNMFGG